LALVPVSPAAAKHDCVAPRRICSNGDVVGAGAHEPHAISAKTLIGTNMKMKIIVDFDSVVVLMECELEMNMVS
jgi:hypothetical protein